MQCSSIVHCRHELCVLRHSALLSRALILHGSGGGEERLNSHTSYLIPHTAYRIPHTSYLILHPTYIPHLHIGCIKRKRAISLSASLAQQTAPTEIDTMVGKRGKSSGRAGRTGWMIKAGLVFSIDSEVAVGTRRAKAKKGKEKPKRQRKSGKEGKKGHHRGQSLRQHVRTPNKQPTP